MSRGRPPDDHLQFTKGVSADHRRGGHRHDATCRGIEHPQRDLNRLLIKVRPQATANEGLSLPLAPPSRQVSKLSGS